MTSSKVSWPHILEMVLQGQDLSDYEASSLMKAWLAEELTPVQTGAFLSALRVKKLHGRELGAMAKVLRDACQLPCPIPSIEMVDTCGTGGDGADTFNISTAVAFTASACGVNIAKHGNRSASGKVGSADVLEALGVPLDVSLERAVNAIVKVKITFLFAPAWHSSLVNLAPLRKSLGVRTVFNLLGPLVNPLRPKAQVLGVAKKELLEPMAESLKTLGLKRAAIVHGSGGLDEASLAGPNEVLFLDNGVIRSSMIDPAKFGISYSSIESLRGGDLSTNKNIFELLLQGKGTQDQNNVVALNTALVLWAAGVEDDLKKGFNNANQSLSQGLPWRKLEELRSALK